MRNAALRRVLGLCSTAVMHPTQRAQLFAAVAELSDFAALVEQAERHGIAPLVALHLADDSHIPGDTVRHLRALAVRHTLAHRARTHVLEAAIASLQAAGVEHLFFKGAAMAHLAYPRPELRAMRDVDMLVREVDTARAEQALMDAGFAPPVIAPHVLHEVSTLVRTLEGFSIQIDLHRRLGLLTVPRAQRAERQTLDALWADAQPLTIGSRTTRAPSKEDLLRLVFRHGFVHALFLDRHRLVSTADLITAMQQWVETIDWQRLRALDGEVFRGLAMLHHVSPLPEPVLRGLDYHPRRAPRAVGADYEGWYSQGDRPGAGFWSYFTETLFPSEWWLRTRHGAGPGRFALLSAWLEHLAEIGFERWQRWFRGWRYPR